MRLLYYLNDLFWFIGMGNNIMSKQEIENLQEQTKILFKVVDKLEQRISSLEKVLASHAKCIGEMREEKKDE